MRLTLRSGLPLVFALAIGCAGGSGSGDSGSSGSATQGSGSASRGAPTAAGITMVAPLRGLAIGGYARPLPVVLALSAQIYDLSTVTVLLNGNPLPAAAGLEGDVVARIPVSALALGQNQLRIQAKRKAGGAVDSVVESIYHDAAVCNPVYGAQPSCEGILGSALRWLAAEYRTYGGTNPNAQAALRSALASISDAIAATGQGYASDPLPAMEDAYAFAAAARGLDAAADYRAAQDAVALVATPWLRLNHLQVRGTHNSYHVASPFPVHPTHRYTHKPLAEQLENQGVRALELDLHYLSFAGLQIYHIALVDMLTTCPTLTGCLQEIRDWSDANPMHHPIFVWIEYKDEFDTDKIDNDMVDAEIRSVLPPHKLITPDDVKRSYSNLRESIDMEGWPTLAESRGKIMIMMLASKTDFAQRTYTYGHTSLDGRVMFVRAEESQWSEPWAVVTKINNPRAAASIRRAQAKNFLIATTTGGAGDSQAEMDARRAAGLRNGANMLKDDFPDDLILPGGAPSLVNPITGPSFARPDRLEGP